MKFAYHTNIVDFFNFWGNLRGGKRYIFQHLLVALLQELEDEKDGRHRRSDPRKGHSRIDQGGRAEIQSL